MPIFIKKEPLNKIAESIPHIRECLIYDIETNSLDLSADVKYFGAYSYAEEKYYLIPINQRGSSDKVRELIANHRVLIGFNNIKFDNPILELNGFDMKYKTVIDLMRVLWCPERIKKNVRDNLIMMEDGKQLSKHLPNHKLETIAEVLKFDFQKGDIDYNIFKKPEWSPDDLATINQYLYRDLKITRDLFEFLCKTFETFIDHMSENDIAKFNWLKTSPGSYAYKVICHKAGLEETYSDIQDRTKKPGGFVREPTGDYFEDVFYCDAASMYPHIMIMFNLFSRGEYSGRDRFELKGRYDDKNLSMLGNVIKNMYLERQRLKKLKDKREYPLKIMMNSIYGIVGSPTFASVYDFNRAYDICSIGQQIIKGLADKFISAGFNVVYGDTDSVMVETKGKHEEVQKILLEYKEDLDKFIPFPQDTFVFQIEDRMKKLWFFKDKTGKFLKKTYLYINDKDQVKMVGGDIKKDGASHLSQIIYEKHIVPRIKNGESIQFGETRLREWVVAEIKINPRIVARTFNIREPSEYAGTTSLQYQIATVLGSGAHELVCNTKIGRIGKGKKYATLEEAVNLGIDDIDLSKTWKELRIFI